MAHTSTKSQLELSIVSLENLLQDGENEEAKYQEFFEQNTIVFNVLGYRNFYSFTKDSGRSLPQDQYTGLKPEPDFIVEREDGLFEIFEIKTPVSKKLRVDSNKYREKFTSEVSSYVSQTITYEKYFTRNPENRQKVKKLYGIDIHEDLDIKIVIGLNDYVDKVRVHQKAREYRYKVDIVTYDEILNRLNQEYRRTYGIYEGLPGFSFHFVIRFKSGMERFRKYFFDVGKNINENRISFYLDENNDVCFEVIDNRGRKHPVKIDTDETKILDKWVYLACEFGKTADGFVMVIGINGIEKDKRVKNIGADITIPLRDITLGCDLNKQNFGNFDSAEKIVYSQTLPFREKRRLFAYFMNKYANFSKVRTYVQFDGHQFMYRDETGSFVQDNAAFKPRYRIDSK